MSSRKRTPRSSPASLPGLHGTNALSRARELHFPAVARRVLDGGVAIGDLCDLRGFLQGADRTDYGASDQQSSKQGPAQMARHAARALGYSACAINIGLVVAVRPDSLGLQLDHPRAWRQRDLLAERSLLGAVFRDPRQYLVRRTVLPDHVPCGPQVRAGAAVRSGGN